MQPTKALAELQAIDLEISRAERDLEQLPEKTSILQSRHKQQEVADLLAKAQALVAEVERGVGRLEDETASIASKMAQEQEKLGSGAITEHKELQHLAREIDALRRRKDKLEMETIALMERADKARSQAKSIEAAITKLQAHEQGLLGAFKSAGGEALARIDDLKRRRVTLCSMVGEEVLDRYEAARRSKHGIGAGVLMGQTCGACGMELPADRLSVLLEGPDIGICPQCRRLLIVRLPGEGG